MVPVQRKTPDAAPRPVDSFIFVDILSQAVLFDLVKIADVVHVAKVNGVIGSKAGHGFPHFESFRSAAAPITGNRELDLLAAIVGLELVDTPLALGWINRKGVLTMKNILEITLGERPEVFWQKSRQHRAARRVLQFVYFFAKMRVQS